MVGKGCKNFWHDLPCTVAGAVESLEKCGSDHAAGETSGAAAKIVERISTAMSEVCYLII